MNRRVVITGMGCISPLGNNVEKLWNNIQAGKSGVGPITRYDTSEHNCKIAAEVKDFDPIKLFGKRKSRRIDLFALYALAAAQQAVTVSGLNISDENRKRIGVIIGTGIGGVKSLTEQINVFTERGPSRVSPFLVPMLLPDSCSASVAIQYGLQGPNMAVVTACATGTNAIGESAELIRQRKADVMVAGGSDGVIIPIAMAGLSVIHALSTRNDAPEKASRPFDLNRDGFVMGDGSAVLVLESLDHALERGATIFAEIKGYGTNNDAYHITAPSPEGAGAAECMRLALQDAKLNTDEIDYINAHGTSTKLNDKCETAAIKTVFSQEAYNVPVSSTKSMTGHLLGASGALEAVICVKALGSGVLPATINYETPDPDCDLDYIPNTAREKKVDNIMSNSFGFGGHNATIILSKY